MTAPALKKAPATIPARPRPVSLGHIDWQILPGKGGKPALFCTDARGYETGSRNNAELLRYIGEAGGVFDFYEAQARGGRQ